MYKPIPILHSYTIYIHICIHNSPASLSFLRYPRLTRGLLLRHWPTKADHLDVSLPRLSPSLCLSLSSSSSLPYLFSLLLNHSLLLLLLYHSSIFLLLLLFLFYFLPFLCDSLLSSLFLYMASSRPLSLSFRILMIHRAPLGQVPMLLLILVFLH